jgi:hypothetical protein
VLGLGADEALTTKTRHGAHTGSAQHIGRYTLCCKETRNPMATVEVMAIGKVRAFREAFPTALTKSLSPRVTRSQTEICSFFRRTACLIYVRSNLFVISFHKG